MTHIARSARPTLVATLSALLGLGAHTYPAGAAPAWTTHGPSTGGVVSAVAAAPSSPSVVYAAMSSAASHTPVYRSVDGGSTWAPTAPDIPSTSISPSHLAVSATDPDVVYYGNYTGVHRSLDGGGSWTSIGTGITGGTTSVSLHPGDPATVYVTTTKGLYRSTDGGGSWATLTGGLPANASASSLAISPSDPDVAYAHVYNPASDVSTLYRSADAGSSWTETALPMIKTLDPQVVVSPSNPDLVHVARPGSGMLRSDDGGATWQSAGAGLPADASFRDLAVSPWSAATLFVSVRTPATERYDVYRTTDGGSSWSIASTGLPRTDALTVWDLSPSAATPGVVYAATGSQAGGVFRSADAGETWAGSAEGLAADLNIRTGLAAGSDGSVWAGVYIGGGKPVHRSPNHGGGWKPASGALPPLSVASIAPAPSDPRIAYLGTYAGPLYRTADGGATWSQLTEPTASTRSIQAVAVHPTNPQIVYAAGILTAVASGAPATVFKSTDGGQTWVNRSLGLPNGVSVGALVIDPAAPDTLYASVSFVGIYKSIDGGGVWFPATAGIAGGAIALAVDPTSPSTLYAGGSQGPAAGVYKTTTGGTVWMPTGLRGQGAVTSVVVNPAKPQEVFASTVSGTTSSIWRSTDGGATWAPLNDGLDTCQTAHALAIDPGGRYVHAATSGRGVYDLPLT